MRRYLPGPGLDGLGGPVGPFGPGMSKNYDALSKEPIFRNQEKITWEIISKVEKFSQKLRNFCKSSECKKK